MRKQTVLLSSILLLVSIFAWMILNPGKVQADGGIDATRKINRVKAAKEDQSWLYFPFVMNEYFVRRTENQRVYMPHFADQIKIDETAVFWFGKVNLTENYADVRVGYTNSELFVHVTIFDRLVWYNKAAPSGNLEDWDATTLYLDMNGNEGTVPTSGMYRFVTQVRPSSAEMLDNQAAYLGDGDSWKKSNIVFLTETGYRGNPNDTKQDSGWRVIYRIPFSSLGVGSPPAKGQIWGLAVAVHDRDDAGGTPIKDTTWPTGINSGQSRSWGELAFGLFEKTSNNVKTQGSVTIRQGLNGAKVVDGEVGGHTNCGQGLERFTEWGEMNYASHPQKDRINIQNQFDVADFPCFAKYFITFPQDQVPPGKVITSAQLTLFQFGNAGGGKWGSAPGSWIQVFTISEAWQEEIITWNNAPQAVENISRSWVPWLASYPGADGIPRVWDVTAAVSEAYAAGEPARLALYSADSSRHSGKYFWSSDYSLGSSRPKLVIHWAEP